MAEERALEVGREVLLQQRRGEAKAKTRREGEMNRGEEEGGGKVEALARRPGRCQSLAEGEHPERLFLTWPIHNDGWGNTAEERGGWRCDG
jgi:hypothetical protein